MTYLMFEMSAWLLAVFVVGLLLGAWVGYACRSHTEDRSLDDGEQDDIDGQGGNAEADDAGRKADLVDELNNDEQTTIDESEGSIEETDAASFDSEDVEVDEAKPANLISEAVSDADDLKKLKGVGPKLEKLLNGLGIYNFQQIADWQQKDVDWVNAQLVFSGRIEREGWVSQSKTLAAGSTTEFAERDKKDKQD
jgi:NADH-quinone oxidoreductase subunit E